MSSFDIEIDVPVSQKSKVLEQVEVYEQGMEWARFGLIECPKTIGKFLFELLQIKL